jgi:hypothetical protein
MQREKLYNLHKTNSLIVAYFTFKTDKSFNDQTSMVLKKNLFFSGFAFFYFIFRL